MAAHPEPTHSSVLGRPLFMVDARVQLHAGLVPLVVLGYRVENAGHTDSSSYQSLSYPR